MRVDIQHPTGSVADARIREGRDQPAHGIRAVHRVGVGEHDDLTPRLFQQSVERGRLAGARFLPEEGDARILLREAHQHLIGAIGGGVGDHHHVQKPARIILVELVANGGFDVRRLVVRRDHHGNARHDRGGVHRTRPDRPQQRYAQRVAGVRVQPDGETHPENDLSRCEHDMGPVPRLTAGAVASLAAFPGSGKAAPQARHPAACSPAHPP